MQIDVGRAHITQHKVSTMANDNERQTALHLMIHGRVQGVGFRSWAVDEARQLGLTGWVRNNDDSTVEMVVCGNSAAVAAMHKDCERGPVAGNVIRVDANTWSGEVPKDFKQVAA